MTRAKKPTVRDLTNVDRDYFSLMRGYCQSSRLRRVKAGDNPFGKTLAKVLKQSFGSVIHKQYYSGGLKAQVKIDGRAALVAAIFDRYKGGFVAVRMHDPEFLAMDILHTDETGDGLAQVVVSYIRKAGRIGGAK